MTVQNITVQSGDAGIRLDRWFRRHYPALTQGALQKMLRSGQIRVDGARAEANTRLETGQDVRVPPMPTAPAPIRPRVSEEDQAFMESLVLYRDASVIVLNKPHGLPVQGGPGITRHVDGLLDALAHEDERPRLVHRLDKDTSGVLVLGRTAQAAAALANSFRGRDAKKTYWAVVVGQPEIQGGRINLPLKREGGARGERTVVAQPADKAGQFAITDYDTLEVARRRVALLEMRPMTGRTHQLRVHAAEALKCPILGDGKYGGEDAHLEELPHELHLHSRALSIPHPEGGMLEVAAGLPPHMLETFRFFDFPNPVPAKPRWRR
ncbi:RluA family pseudouridine synthase [Rhodovarius crocodyli]|uniref:Pseudouridine synthase n=1 Tax=Rhodovarius crocodyli TaxID=1979269 RepID=A0A437MMK6_9PROT|nr:RluA family pseudouridine synthase [Rhodovarius crocodyli]RVT98846.1 RluA family pseudouridine synthase [Rhodovarius crocodyli]